MKKAYLVLADGHVFAGERFGADCDAAGELVFTTGMGGYLETVTDPSYYGQIIMQTFPLIGNYGVIKEDFESRGCAAFGYVVREWCKFPSNFRCEKDIDTWLKELVIPGLSGVDTRAITQIIREQGVMNACICADPSSVDIEKLRSFSINNAVNIVTSKKTVNYKAADERFKVALIDYGAKKSIIHELNKAGCTVTVYPANVTAETILSTECDGIALSNGPGNPANNLECIEELKKLIGKKPIFGICLGHQLLAMAAGGKTEKLKYGHRGVNQPVKRLSDGRVFITSQNHGYAVVSDSLKTTGGKESFVNANDGTCEGIVYPEQRAFTVQFHPEACAGPKDCNFIFQDFIGMMKGVR